MLILNWVKSFVWLLLILKGYDSHLFMPEINKSDVEIRVTPNGLEIYMAAQNLKLFG